MSVWRRLNCAQSACLWACELNRPIIISIIHHQNPIPQLSLSPITFLIFSSHFSFSLSFVYLDIDRLIFASARPRSSSSTQSPWPRSNASNKAVGPAGRASLSSSLCFLVRLEHSLYLIPSAANVLSQVNRPSARYSYFIFELGILANNTTVVISITVCESMCLLVVLLHLGHLLN
jgi:hypothetical protein